MSLPEGMGIPNTIQSITPFTKRPESKNGSAMEQLKESVFGSIFKNAIQDVKDTDAEFVNAQYLLATGQLDNPAEVGIAGYKNEIAVDLLIQLRNRALDVYNELKSMSV